MSRLFTLVQAQALLPEAERLLRHVLACREQFVEAGRELAELKRNVLHSGGMRLSPERVLQLKTRHEGAARGIEEGLAAIHALGVQVKDLDSGLVDFPTRYRGAVVLLCWKLGEAGIAWWHGGEEGFAGRKRIDRDFLDHHRGDERA